MLNKRFLSLLLSLTMIFSCFSGFAAEDINTDAADTQMTESFSDEQNDEESGVDLFSANLFSSSGEIEGTDISWNFTSSGMLNITGNGAIPNFSNEDAPWEEHREYIRFIYVNDGITGIGDYAFSELDDVRSVYLADTVSYIGASAFENCGRIKEIELPDSVKTIGANAFKHCTSLKSFVVSAGVESVASTAFSGCGKLKEFEVADDNAYYCEIDGVLFSKDGTVLVAFPDKMNEDEYVVPDSVVEIAANAFDNCEDLEYIEFPDTLTTIGDNAFYGCESLEEVYIPAGVTDIAQTAFLYDCYSLRAINVDEENAAYSSEYGVLFDKEKTRLIRFPAECDEAVDEGMYIMPNTVTVIGQEAFLDCQTVEILWIYGALQKIEMAAFMIFDPLMEIWFDGTQFNWDMVEKGIFNEKLDEVPVICMEPEFEEEFDAKVGVTYYLEEFVDLKGNESILENLVVSSSDTTVAVVDKEKMTAVAPGSAIISAVVLKDGMVYAAAVKVNVTENGTGSKESSFHLVQEDTMDLKRALSVPVDFLDNLIWTSTDESVVMVVNGEVTAIGPGEATVIATVNSSDSLNYSVKCKIIVERKYTDEAYFEFSNGIIKKYIGPDSEVMIPPTIGGVAVTGIGVEAFKNCAHVYKVELPETVKRIESSAFAGCTSLANINIFEGITYIGDYAFRNCESLLRVRIPASVTSTTSYWFEGCTRLAHIEFAKGTKNIYQALRKSSVKSVVIPSTVTKITTYAFSGCTMLEEIIIPDSVTSIGSYAFENCYSLETVILGNGLSEIPSNAFYGCTNLIEVDLGEKITSIGYRAFARCESLVDITIPGKVQKIDGYAFAYCYELANVTLTEGLSRIESYAFYDCDALSFIELPYGLTMINSNAFAESGITYINIPDTVTTLGSYVFYNCTALESVYVGNGVVKLANYAFSGCTALTDIELGNAIADIGSYAFANTGITSIVIPDSVKSMGSSVFSGCNSLTDITIGNGMRTITKSLFNGCNSVKNITLSEGITSIDSNAFSNCSSVERIVLPDSIISIGSYAFSYCSSLKEIVLGNGLKTIGTYAFYYCQALSSIRIPDSVETIGNNAFYWCSALQNVEFGSGLKSIGSYAFYFCGALKGVKLPEGLESIGVYAFYNCEGLEYVTIPDSLTTISNYAFYNARSLVNLDLGNGVRVIGNNAFCNNISLVEVVIPDSTTHINDYAFAYNKLLSDVTLGKNLVHLGYRVFYGCSNLSFKDGIPESLIKYIMDNNLFDNGDLAPSFRYFEPAGTGYYAKDSDMLGYVKMELKYQLKKGIKATNKSIRINIPSSTFLVEGSVKLDGEPYANVTTTENTHQGYNYITISGLSDNATQGVFTFFLKPSVYTKISTYAQMTVRVGGRSSTEILGYANCSLPEISISAPDTTGKADVIVDGLTTPGADVKLYVDGQFNKAVTASSWSGAYKTNITINNPENYRDYTITAEVTGTDGEIHTADTVVRYVTNTPNLEGFTLYYGKNGQGKAEYDLFNSTARPVIRWGNYSNGSGYGYSYYFSIDISPRDTVDKVYVVSTKNNKKSYLEAVWNSETQRYETSGYFENYYDYIPGVLTIEYTKSADKSTHSLSDIGTYLNYGDDFTSSVTDYTSSTFSAEVDVKGVLAAIFGDRFSLSSETVDRDYSGVSDSELSVEKNKYYSYIFHKNGNKYAIVFNLQNAHKASVVLHDITGGKETTYNVTFEKNNKDGSKDKVTVNDILERADEYAGRLLNVYDIDIDIDKLKDDLKNSGKGSSIINNGLKKADSLNIKKRMFILTSVILSASRVDKIAAPSEILSGMLDIIEEDVSYFRDQKLLKRYRIGPEVKIRWLIDPSGYVYEAISDNRIQGATATLLYTSLEDGGDLEADSNGYVVDQAKLDISKAVVWDAENYDDQINPQITNEHGEFKWVTPEGYYIVKYEKAGYDTVYSKWIKITEIAKDDLYVEMISKEAPVVSNVNLTNDYMVLSFDKYIKADSLKDVKIGNAEYTMEYDTATKNSAGDVITKDFTFRFAKALPTGTPYTVSVENAVSYAEVLMQAFSAEYTTPGEPLPKELMFTDVVANETLKSIDVKYLNNSSSDVTVNIACAIYDENGDLVRVEIVTGEEIKLGAELSTGFQFSNNWNSYKIFTWNSKSLKPEVSVYDSTVIQ